MMQEFRLANPEYLSLLLLLPFIQAFFNKLSSNAKEKLLKFVSEKNLHSLLKERGEGGGNRKKIFYWLGIIFIILALARPQGNPSVEELDGASLDIYVLLDVSKSMDTEDVPPSRLRKAKKSIMSMMSLLSGDRVGIIAFAGTAVTLAPLTGDYDVLSTFLENVDTSLIQNQGTDIVAALEIADERMQKGAERTGSGGQRTNIFVVMSDGEDQQKQDLGIVEKIRNRGGTIFSIAFGTESGGFIPVRNDRGELAGYKRDRQGNQVKSAVQTKILREVAEKGGGVFYFSTLGEDEIKDLLNRIKGFERNSTSVMKAKVYQEFYWPVLTIGVLLLLLSFFSIRMLFSLQPKNIFKTSLILFILHPSIVFASPLSFFWDKEKNAFEKSKNLASDGKQHEAVDSLKPLLAEDPENPAINFAMGTYLQEAKKPEEARKQLGRIAEKENDLREKSLFNIAGSFAQEGKKDQARSYYAQLLRNLSLKSPKTPADEQLIEQTKKNLSHLSENSEKQQQSSDNQSQSPQDKQENKQESKQSDNNSQENNPEKKEEKKDQDKPDSGKDSPPKEGEQKPEKGENPSPKNLSSQKPSFKEREDMSEENAQNILKTLKQRETGLQKNFLKRKTNDGKNSENEVDKDW